MEKECYNCGFRDEDYGCTCPSTDKWYACPIASELPENIEKLEEYIKMAESEGQNEFTHER